MSIDRPTESGARGRTRRAILDAAVQVLRRNSAASLSEVAHAAEVGRTTVHRYFPERADLLRAIGEDANERSLQAVDNARLDDGPADEALRRLCREYYDLGDVLMLIFNTPSLADTMFADSDDDPAEAALIRAVERGHADGTVDPGMSAPWVQQMLWTTLYSGWDYQRMGCATKHEALDLVVQAFSRIIAVQD